MVPDGILIAAWPPEPPRIVGLPAASDKELETIRADIEQRMAEIENAQGPDPEVVVFERDRDNGRKLYAKEYDGKEYGFVEGDLVGGVEDPPPADYVGRLSEY